MPDRRQTLLLVKVKEGRNANRKAGVATRSVHDLASDATQRGVASVEVAGRILAVVEKAPGAIALGEIAHKAAMSSSRAHHYLVSLMKLDLVRRDASTGRYMLGDYALQLGLAALERVDAGRASMRVLDAFRDETGETAFFSLWGSHGPTIITWSEGRRPVTVQVRAGLVMSLLLSATGHVFLAWSPAELLHPILDRELAASPPGSRKALARRIDALRETTLAQGLASIRGTLLPHIAALSAPVFAHDGKLAGAISTLGWTDVFDANPAGVLARTLKKHALYFSSELGFRRS
jgi:DNA-binding IclR family transcriptional regulator